MAEKAMKYDSGRFNDESWSEHFEALRDYLQLHNKYPNDRNSKLKSWVYKQKQRGKMGRLTSGRINLLNSIDFDWGCSRLFIRAVDASESDDIDNQHLESIGSSAAVSIAQSSLVDSIVVDKNDLQRASRDSSKEKFKVRIPVYYKEIYPGSALEQSVAATDAEDLAAGIENKIAENLSNGDNERALSNGTSDEISSAKEERAMRHKQFIAVLEKYGSNQGSENGTLAWHAMAGELKWTIEDVKVYAYSYFKFLTGEKRNQSNPTQVSKKPKLEAVTTNPSWACDDLMLLDTLILKHCSMDDLKHKDGDVSFAWKKIAAGLPGKTPIECRQMGISRN